MSRFFAGIYDGFMRRNERACLEAWRGELLADVGGEVLEIGAGTGANVPFYRPAVRRVVLAEPDPHMLARLDAKWGGGRRAGIELSTARADALPFADETFDAVVSTLVLCSVPDVGRALAEAKRVLRPGGTFVFLEHVAADELPSRLAWQRRFEPLWKRVAGNCHLTRRTGDEIRAAGFEVEREVRESMRKAAPFFRTSIRGLARRGR